MGGGNMKPWQVWKIAGKTDAREEEAGEEATPPTRWESAEVVEPWAPAKFWEQGPLW